MNNNSNEKKIQENINTPFDGDISHWSLEQPKAVSAEISNTSFPFDGAISGWDIKPMPHVDSNFSFNPDISGWDLSKVGALPDTNIQKSEKIITPKILNIRDLSTPDNKNKNKIS